jgi:HTH-type transcriptional regulator/antitoxin HigA
MDGAGALIPNPARERQEDEGMSDNERRPAEVFRPGEYVRDELIARGWTVDDLADKSGLMRQTLESLIREDHEPMTQEIAEGLSRALGTSVVIWLNMDRYYTKWKTR